MNFCLNEWLVICLKYLHVVSSWAEPLKQEDHECGQLDEAEANDHPRGQAERLWKWIKKSHKQNANGT